MKERWEKKKATLKRLLVINLGLLLSVRGLKIPCACFCFCAFLFSSLPPFPAVPGEGGALDGSHQCWELFSQFLSYSETLGSPERSAKTLAPAKDLKRNKQGCPGPTPPTRHTPQSNQPEPAPHRCVYPELSIRRWVDLVVIVWGCGMCLSDVECEGGAGG